MGLLLLGAAAAEAQTPRILVSNVSQGSDDVANTSGNDHAQLFRTAGATNGYTLTSVTVVSEDAEGDAFDVEICAEDGTANEFPSTTASDCTALTAPGSFTAGNLGFTHAGLALSANTNYVVVVKPRSGANVAINSTTSSGEDSTGLSMWSIKNYFYWNNSGTWTNQSGTNEALRITVNGHEGAPVVVTPPVVTTGTEIWSATLTVGRLNALAVGFSRIGGSLDDTTFSFGGTEYTIQSVLVDSVQLALNLGDTEQLGDAANNLVLHVGTQTYPLADASYSSIQNAYAWYSNIPSWSVSDMVALKITDTTPVAPTVTGVELTSTATTTTYAIGDEVEATVTFSAGVDITGTPQLELDFAGTPKAAPCANGTNTTTMVCEYEVGAGDLAPNGIAIAANKLTGGTITATGSTTITADLDHVALAIDAGHKVDGIRPTLVTTGTDAPTTSTDGTKVILTFSEDISSVDRTKITIMAGGNVASTSAASAAGTKVELALTTALTTTTTTLTVALSADAVEDAAANGNLAVPATPVTNTVVTTTAPTVTSVELTSATTTYAIGDEVEATVTFSAGVDITGTPQLELDFAGTPKPAACANGTNTTTMVCRYTVVAGDSAPNGIAIAANKLTGGTITATGSTTINADLDHAAVAIDAGHKVDGIRPTLVTTGTDAPTTSTDGTQVILTFSEDLSTVDRTQITIMSGTDTLSTSAASAAGTKVEVALTTALTDSTTTLTVALSADAVEDAAANGNLAVPATAVTNAVVTTTAPTVTAVDLTSTATTTTYAIGDEVEATVTFSAGVDITGTPQLELDFAGTTKPAACTAATNTTTMACGYTVVAGDVAPNGIAIAANQLTGGTITATGSTTNNADLDHAAVAIDAAHKVDGIRPTLVTTGNGAPTTSTDGAQVILTFSEDLSTVDRTRITIMAGGNVASTTAASAAGTKVELALTTALTTTTTNLTVALSADAVEDAAANGNLAVPATSVTNTVVTTTAPTVTSVELTSATTTYAIGDEVEATVTFSAGVDITGTPQLELDFAGTPKPAACATGTTTTTIVCGYTVVAGDVAPNGIAIAANKLTGGTITATGSPTINAVLTHAAVAIDAVHKVDGIRPTLVTTGTDAPTTSTDGTQVILTFSEDLSTVDRTRITIMAGGNVASTTAASAAGTKVELALTTALTTTTTNLTVALSADAVEDAAANGNLAVPATSVTNTVVTTTAPTVTSVELTSATTTYAIGDEVEATVTFSAGVDITGTPQLELDFAGTPKPAACATGTTTTTIVCGYTVVAGDVAPNGIAIAANKLTGGTITATGSPTINAVLTHAAVAIDAVHKVDGIRPTLDSATVAADGASIDLAFDEPFSLIDATLVAATRFGVTADGSTVTVGELVFLRDGGVHRTLSLQQLSPTITYGQAVIVSYADLTTGDDTRAVIQDAAGNDVASFTTGSGAVPAVVVTTAPTVTAVELTSTATTTTYAIGDGIEATVTFSAGVDITGTPQLELDFAGTPKPFACGAATKTNTTTMLCSYTVVAGDSAPNGIAIAANKLTGGTITATGSTTNNADLDHAAVAIDAAHKVDGIRPTLVTTGTDAPTTTTDGTQVILTFSEDLSTVDRTRITIMSGTDTLSTSAASAAGTKVELDLTTALTAMDTNLTVALSADAVEDAAANGNLAVSATPVTNTVVTTTAPTVTSVELTSATTTYAIGDEVEATVTFSAGVDITGTPQLELDFAGTPKPAACATGTTTTTIVCGYTVVAGDSAPNGIAIAANQLTGGTITATGSTTINADLAHAAVAIDAGHKVDGIRPTLDSATVAADGASIDLVFDEELDADPFPSFDISAFGVTADGNAVTFSVELVSSGDRAYRIVRLSTPAIAADQAVIVSYTDPTTGDDTAVLQDAAANDVASFTTGSAGVPAVTNTANAPPAFEAASTTREVAENSAAGTNVGDPVTATGSGDPLTYTLEGTDAASFYIVSTSGQIRTKSGVTYDYETKSSYALIVKAEDLNGSATIAVTITVTDVDDSTTAPTVTSVDLTSTSTTTTYAIGDEVEATVTFSAGVDITGTPQLELDFAGTPKPAACTAATNTTTMACGYTVVAGDSAPNGIAIAANKLTGGTITATASTTIDAVLAHAAVAIDAGHKVDGIRPTLVTTGTDAPTTTTDGTQVILTFSETIGSVDRTRITIMAGTTTLTTTAASATGTKVEVALTTALTTTTTNLTVALSADAVEDAAANGNLAVQAAAVTNTAIVPNAPPAFQAASTTREVAENSAAGTNVGAPVTATDADSGDPLTYTLEGTDAASFDIVSTSGQIRTKSGVTYDYETKSSYALIVKADDSNGGSDTIAVTITVTDVEDSPAVRAWLGRFGRTVSGQVLDAVEERLRATRAAGVSVRVAGQRIDLTTKADPEEEAEKESRARLAALSDWLGQETQDGKRAGMQSRTVTAPEAMMGSSFALAAKTHGGGSAAVWGRMAQSRFSGREGGLSLDSDVTTGLLGAEYARGPLAGGAVLSNSRGEGGYGGDAAGRVAASMTAVTPWAGYKVSERLSVWGALGYGAGELTLTPKDQPGQRTDLAMTLAAGGARGTVVDGDGPKLDAVADARWVRTTSEKASSSDGYLAATSADVTRLRLGLEGSWAMTLDDQGATVTPRLSFGVRHDGGDAETGFGADIGGGVLLAIPARGLSVSLEGRGLLIHEAKGFSDTGFGASVAWDQAPSSKRGPSLTVRHSVGGSATGGKDALFSREVMDGLAANGNQRLEGRVGYGLAVYGERFTGTPELGYGLSDSGRDYRLGWRVTREGRDAGSFEASLETTRRETANDNDPEHGIGFRLTARW